MSEATSNRKGILLAGGDGTRLYPTTRVVSKHLLPVYDKPLIYYPLSTLMLAGIREILVITRSSDQELFEQLLGDGGEWGLEICYEVQSSPEGIAQALVIAESFLNGKPSALILGDNLFYGEGLTRRLRTADELVEGATIFAYGVSNPGRYGVVRFGPDDQPIEIVEKPTSPPSRYAVTGLYFYDARAPEVAQELEPSERGEYEITDVNNWYLERGKLSVERLGRGYAWLDTGTPDALHAASDFVRALEERQGVKAACPEEIAYRLGYIDAEELANLAYRTQRADYADYLQQVLEEEDSSGGGG